MLSVLPHSSHNSKGLTVREYVMSCQDVSEMGDRPHALGGCPNTSDGRIAQRLTYLGKHRAFRWASICRLQAVDGCVPQMNWSRVITGHEQMDEEGSARYRWCSSLAQSPKHPDGNAIARIARLVQHFRALLARLLAASAAAEAAITAVVMRPIFARHADVQDDLRFRRRTQLKSGLPITIWPYSPFTDTAPMDVPLTKSEVPPSPLVIVMSGLSNGVPDNAAPERPVSIKGSCTLRCAWSVNSIL